MMTMPTPIALTLKTARFEWTAFAMLSIVGVAIAIVAADRLRSLSPAPECLPLAFGGPILASDLNACSGLQAFLEFRSAVGDRLAAVVPWVPALFGAVIGSQIVSRDLEMRTSQLVWSLEPTRRRWFAERAGLALAGVIAFASVSAVAGSILAAARLPGIDLANSFAAYGNVGPVVVVRAAAAASLGIAAGALIGRILPSVLVSLVLAAAIVILGPGLAVQALPTQVVPATESSPDRDALVLAGGWLNSDGRVLNQDEARALSPNPADVVAAQNWVADQFDPVRIQLPGTDATRAQALEIAGLGIVTLTAIAIAFVVAQRRRVT